MISIQDIDNYITTLNPIVYSNKIDNYINTKSNKIEFYIQQAIECFQYHKIDFSNKNINIALINQVLFYCGIQHNKFDYKIGPIAPYSQLIIDLN